MAAPQRDKRAPPIVVGVRKNRKQFYRLVELRESRFMLTRPVQGVAEIVAGFRKVRLEAYGFLIAANRRREIVQARENETQEMMCVRGPLVALDKRSQRSLRLAESFLLQPKPTQRLKRPEVETVTVQDTQIDSFRVSKPALRLKCQGEAEIGLGYL